MKQDILTPDFEKIRYRHSLLRGLDATTLANMLDAATDRQEPANCQWLLARVMKRWPMLRALYVRRIGALSRKEWNIITNDSKITDSTKQLAEEQVAALRESYDKIDNLTESIRFLAYAEFAGFSHLQKHRDSTGETVHLEPLDQWCWVRDGYRGPWLFNQTAQPNSAYSLKKVASAQIDTAEFIIREVENPLYECALPRYLSMSLALRDWGAYSEMFGMPHALIIAPESATTETKMNELLETALDMGTGKHVVWPFGTQAEFPGESRAEPPFASIINKCETDICLACTGGKLAMLSDSTGLDGGSNSKTHQDAFNEIAEAEAVEISEVFQRQFDKEILSRLFPGKPVLAYFKIAGKDEADATAVSQQISNLSSAGYFVDPNQIEALIGYKVSPKPMPSYNLGQVPSGGKIDPSIANRINTAELMQMLNERKIDVSHLFKNANIK